jgi:hypothetical protein
MAAGLNEEAMMSKIDWGVIWDEAFRGPLKGGDPEEHLRGMIQEILDSLVAGRPCWICSAVNQWRRIKTENRRLRRAGCRLVVAEAICHGSSLSPSSIVIIAMLHFPSIAVIKAFAE